MFSNSKLSPQKILTLYDMRPTTVASCVQFNLIRTGDKPSLDVRFCVSSPYEVQKILLSCNLSEFVCFIYVRTDGGSERHGSQA